MLSKLIKLCNEYLQNFLDSNNKKENYQMTDYSEAINKSIHPYDEQKNYLSKENCEHLILLQIRKEKISNLIYPNHVTNNHLISHFNQPRRKNKGMSKKLVI